MNKKISITLLVMILFLGSFKNLFALAGEKSPPVSFPSNVHFIENKKQWENFIRYEADFKGGKLFLEDNRFTYLFYHPDDIQAIHPHQGKATDKIRLHAIRVHPSGGNPHPEIRADDPANYFNNYFIGSDSSKWAHDVKLFSSVTYQNMYPGIDMKFYSNRADIKYDIIVHSGGNADEVKLKYEGVDDLSIQDGALQMKLSVGTIVEQKPYAYQLINGNKNEIECRFVLKKNKVGFYFPHGYNQSLPLIIDPVLIFSSFTGSTADNWGFTATYDAAGNAYGGGNVNAPGYPATLGAYDLSYNGGGAGGNGWDCDMAIAKFNATGTSLLYATYLGGADNEQPQSLIVDGNDNLVIFGISFSSNYPVTAGAYQPTNQGNGDMVISKLSSTGNTLIASTFIGGNAEDGININSSFFTGGSLKYNYGDEARGEIIADANNNYIIGSCTKSTNFPVTGGVLQPAFGGGMQDGILFQINSSLTALNWSTFIGGSNDDAVYDCTFDNNGDLFIAGGTNSTNFPTTAGVLHTSYQGGLADGFIAHINSGGNIIIASTYIGTPSYDQTYFVELDYSGNVYTTGQTEGVYPVTAGVYSNPGSSQFIHKMDPGLTTTFYSTVFGTGTNIPNLSPTAFLVDTCENVYVAGWGRCISVGTSGDVFGMPVTPNAFQSTTDGCDFYFFVLNHDASSLLYATFFGGNISHEHVDGGTSRFNKNGVIYESVCAGCGGNSDFPTTPGVVSNVNNSNNCNNGVIKLEFDLARTVSSITTSPSYGCVPFTLTFVNNSVNASSFIWDFDDGSPISNLITPTHTFSDTGVFHVMLVAINNSSCNQNDTSFADIIVHGPNPVVASYVLLQNSPCDTVANAIFTGIGGDLYQWNFGDGYMTTGTSVSHVYADTGTFIITLIVTDTFCMATADTTSQPVTFHSQARANVTVTGAVSGCAPFPVTFNNASTLSGNHFWNFADGSPPDTNMNPVHTFNFPGVFDVTFIVTDPYSCNGSDTAHVLITVPVSIPFIPSFTLTPSPACDTLRASVHYDGSGGHIYHWLFGDGQQAYGTDATHYYAATGNYNVVLIAEDTVCDLIDTVSHPVSFRPFVAAGVNTHQVNSGCVPQSVDLSNSFPSIGNYHWYLGDGTAYTGPSVHHTYTDTGSYTILLIVEDTASCNLSDTSFFTFTVFPDPVAGFVYDQQVLYFIKNDIRFYDRSYGAETYRWDFGDGTSATDSVATHQFAEGGTFDVCLTVTSSHGCIDSTCSPLELLNSEMIYAPNAFTPNDDGVNDAFRIRSFGLTDLEVMIFNRWGEKIYEYHSVDGSWNGIYKGKPVEEDVYIWRLKAKGIVHDEIIRYGRVSVVR
ncbi:MAG: PKD domain-containing protein [Bacteroidetes bacterium]|nr:PKD domain-containing protein [Bacteroidota bacterium]